MTCKNKAKQRVQYLLPRRPRPSSLSLFPCLPPFPSSWRHPLVRRPRSPPFSHAAAFVPALRHSRAPFVQCKNWVPRPPICMTRPFRLRDGLRLGYPHSRWCARGAQNGRCAPLPGLHSLPTCPTHFHAQWELTMNAAPPSPFVSADSPLRLDSHPVCALCRAVRPIRGQLSAYEPRRHPPPSHAGGIASPHFFPFMRMPWGALSLPVQRGGRPPSVRG